LLCLVHLALAPVAVAGEEPRWVKLADFEAPESALRVYGNAPPPTPAAEALWSAAQAATGAWANPVVCRVNYRRSFVPGELDLDQGICVLFMHTRLGSETACTIRDSVCRIHVPLGAGVEVLNHAGSMHLIPLADEAKAPRGTVALDANGLMGKWRLCLSGGHVGATEQAKVACMTGSGGERTGVDFGYGDSAATERRQLDILTRWVGERRARLTRVLTVAQAAQSTDDIDSALSDVEAVNVGVDAELTPLLDGLVGAGAQEAKAIMERGLGDVTKALAAQSESLKRRRQVAEALADIDALVARINATLVSARSAEGESAEAAAFVEALDRYASSLGAVLDDGVLTDTVHEERAERLASLMREIVSVTEALEPRLSSGDRTARLAHHLKRLTSPPLELSDLSAAVAVFMRLQSADDPFVQQQERVAIVDGVRSTLLARLSEGLYADMKDPERGPRAHLAALAGFATAFEGWRTLPESMAAEAMDEATSDETRRMAEALRAAGLSWRWEVPERVPGWDDAWAQADPVVDPATLLARRVEGPLVVEKTKGWLASALGDALAPELKYWFVCVGEGKLEGPRPLVDHLGQCIVAQDGLGPMVDEEPLGEASEPLEAVEAVWATLLAELEAEDEGRCKEALKTHEAHTFAEVIEAACVKAKVADKQRVKDRRVQKKLAKTYGKMMKAMGKRKWKKASKALKSIRKRDTRGFIGEALLATWGESIAEAQAQAERLKAEAAEAKRQARAQKTARKRADKLMRKVPGYEPRCQRARETYTDAVTVCGAAAMDGDTAREKRFTALKDKAQRGACRLQAEALVVHGLYRDLGDADSADAVKRAAPSCFRGWECR
jgi:hypothetical protein